MSNINNLQTRKTRFRWFRGNDTSGYIKRANKEVLAKMEHEKEILPNNIIKQRIQRMAEDIDPYAFQQVRENPDPKSVKYQFWMTYCVRADKTAKTLVAAGWAPGPIGEKPILDKYFKT